MAKDEFKRITDHPFALSEAQTSDAEALADIYYRNLPLAYPSQADLIENTIDKDRLVQFFTKIIESAEQQVFILKGFKENTPYGFFTIGKALGKTQAQSEDEERVYLHHIFVDPDYHRKQFGEMLWRSLCHELTPKEDRYERSADNNQPILTTIISKSNLVAIEVFKQAGAKNLGTTTITTFAGEEDESIIMGWDNLDNLRAALEETAQKRAEGLINSGTQGPVARPEA